MKKSSGTGKDYVADIYNRTTLCILLDLEHRQENEVVDLKNKIQQRFRLPTATSISICNLGAHVMAMSISQPVLESYVHDHHDTFTTLRIRSLRLLEADDQQYSDQLRALLLEQALIPFGGVHPTNEHLPVLLYSTSHCALAEYRHRPHFALSREVRLQFSLDPSPKLAEFIAQVLSCEISNIEMTGVPFDHISGILSPSDVFLRSDLAPPPTHVRVLKTLTSDELLQLQLGISPSNSATSAATDAIPSTAPPMTTATLIAYFHRLPPSEQRTLHQILSSISPVHEMATASPSFENDER